MKLIKDHKYWRALEMVPGITSWAAILFPIVMSFYFPTLVAVLLIIYSMLWLFRSVQFSVNLYRSYQLVRKAQRVDWQLMLDCYAQPQIIKSKRKSLKKDSKNNEATLEELTEMEQQIQALKEAQNLREYKKIHHAILYVTYKESLALIRQSVGSYASSKMAKKMIFVFAAEERDEENSRRNFEILKEEFGNDFLAMIMTVHPKDLPNEIPGKSANATWAAKELKEYLDQRNIAYEDVILSNFDADTVAEKNYFEELTLKYLLEPKRTRRTFQPTHMFHNNIWDVPLAMRIVSIGCAFFRMSESMEKDKYRSFSSRSMGFQLAVDTDYWDPMVIPEDAHQYWTAYMQTGGDHHLVSVHTPVYMDAVLADGYLKTFKEQYIQLRRWAWGVCEFPFVTLNHVYNQKMSLWLKVRNIYRVFEHGFFWATGPLLITFAGWMPQLINPGFNQSVIAHNLPNVLGSVLTISLVGILLCSSISLMILPQRTKGNALVGKLSLIFQWVLVPFVSIFLSAIPALEAQTRLMIGKRLDYKVTEKARK